MDDSRERTRSSKGRAAAFVVLFLIIGSLMGIVSKYLDTTAVNDLPALLQRWDVTNFLGRPAVWIFLAVVIACFSGSPFRAAWYVPAFLLGMVGSYYLYSRFVAGFFPRQYAMIWFGLTLISPLLAFLCWYAGGKSPLSLILTAAVWAVMFDLTFVYGVFYLDLVSPLEAILFAATLLLLRKSGRALLLTLLLAAAMALALHLLHVPFLF